MSVDNHEAELRRMMTKAFDDMWIAGFEKGKVNGRRAGLEEALSACKPPNEEAKTEFDAGAYYATLDCIAKIRALLEAE